MNPTSVVPTSPQTGPLDSVPAEPDTQPWGFWSGGRQKPQLTPGPYKTPPGSGQEANMYLHLHPIQSNQTSRLQCKCWTEGFCNSAVNYNTNSSTDSHRISSTYQVNDWKICASVFPGYLCLNLVLITKKSIFIKNDAVMLIFTTHKQTKKPQQKNI